MRGRVEGVQDVSRGAGGRGARQLAHGVEMASSNRMLLHTHTQDGLNDKELQTLIAEAREEFPLKKPKDVGMDA